MQLASLGLDKFGGHLHSGLLVNGTKHDGKLPQNMRELKTSGNSFQQDLKQLAISLFKRLRTNYFEVRLDAR